MQLFDAKVINKWHTFLALSFVCLYKFCRVNKMNFVAFAQSVWIPTNYVPLKIFSSTQKVPKFSKLYIDEISTYKI